jgi:hypothetical protein
MPTRIRLWVGRRSTGGPDGLAHYYQRGIPGPASKRPDSTRPSNRRQRLISRSGPRRMCLVVIAGASRGPVHELGCAYRFSKDLNCADQGHQPAIHCLIAADSRMAAFLTCVIYWLHYVTQA